MIFWPSCILGYLPRQEKKTKKTTANLLIWMSVILTFPKHDAEAEMPILAVDFKIGLSFSAWLHSTLPILLNSSKRKTNLLIWMSVMPTLPKHNAKAEMPILSLDSESTVRYYHCRLPACLQRLLGNWASTDLEFSNHSLNYNLL